MYDPIRIERMRKHKHGLRLYGAVRFQAVVRGHLARLKTRRLNDEQAQRLREEQRRRDEDAQKFAKEQCLSEEKVQQRREECQRAIDDLLKRAWEMSYKYGWLALVASFPKIVLPGVSVGLLIGIYFFVQFLEHPPPPPGSKPKVWRQAIDCCDHQKVTLPIPHSARRNDLVGVQWYERFHRKVTYERLRGSERELLVPIAWDLAGLNGCTPREDRDCQYGYTPYVEMVAIQISCSGEECYTLNVPWSWGNQSFTMPTWHNAKMASRNIMYLASFPPNFAMTVPYTLDEDASLVPFHYEGEPGPAPDRPIEIFPEQEMAFRPWARLKREVSPMVSTAGRTARTASEMLLFVVLLRFSIIRFPRRVPRLL